jgi:cytochrome c553
MRTALAFVLTATSFLASGASLAAQQAAAAAQAPPIPWAYPVNPPAAGGAGGGAGRAAGGGGGAARAAGAPGGAAAAPATAPLLSVPGSTRQFTAAQTRDGFNIADWRPDLHPEMPEIVSQGRRPDVRACGFCHMATGYGRPENASLAGQPAAYIVQQMADFKNDLRVSSEPRMGPPRAMLTLAKAATEEEARIAAAYFESVTYPRWIRVVETNTVPRTSIAGGMFVPNPDGSTEPIGERIVEVPENLERTELRDPGSGFIAYVPTGSIARGRTLVTNGQCTLCHGTDLRGMGPVPALASRSPSYMARQLYDLKSGARKGAWSPLMKGVVANLTPADILNIVAYTASLEP